MSPKVGLRVDASDALQVFANWSESCEPPSFGELSGGSNITPVGAQDAHSVQLGLRWNSDRFHVDAALYRAELEGELLALSDGNGNPLGTVNADDTLHQGLELGVRWHGSDALDLSARDLYKDFRFAGDAV